MFLRRRKHSAAPTSTPEDGLWRLPELGNEEKELLAGVSPIIDRAVADERMPTHADLDTRLINHDLAYVHWVYERPWVGGSGPSQETVDRWQVQGRTEREESWDHVLRYEAGSRVPRTRKLQDGWEAVQVPSWFISGPAILHTAASTGYVERDGVFYGTRCRHGIVMPPRRGGACPRGCRTSLALMV